MITYHRGNLIADTTNGQTTTLEQNLVTHSKNHIISLGNVFTHDFVKLGDILNKQHKITSFKIYGNTKGHTSVIDMIRRNKVLTELSFDFVLYKNNNFLLELCEVLHDNAMITSLHLPHNYIKDDIQPLCDLLIKNTTLTSLDLRQNELGSFPDTSNVEKLCDVLETGDTSSIKKLCDVLKINTTLTSLNLQYNPLYKEEINAEHLNDMINTTALKILDLEGCLVSSQMDFLKKYNKNYKINIIYNNSTTSYKNYYAL
jgi:hypothetical protein